MIIEQCIPTLIFTIFSLIQIIVDMFNGLFEIALLKFFIMTVICYLLNTFCSLGLASISWLIIFVPFIFLNIVIIAFVILKIVSYLKTFFSYNIYYSNTYCKTKNKNNIVDINKNNIVDINENNIVDVKENNIVDVKENNIVDINENNNNDTNYNISNLLDYYIIPYSSVPDYSSDPQFK
jgi:hypothetical protein